MLESITIERFKSIVEAKLDLGRINMFIGGNGAGKSNVLEAIGVVSAAVGRGLTERDFLQNGVRLTPPRLMNSAFREVSDDSFELGVSMFDGVQYQVKLNGTSVLSELCQLHGNTVFERTPDSTYLSVEDIVDPSVLVNDRGMWDQIRAISGIQSEVRIALDAFAQYRIYTPQAHFLRGMQQGSYSAPVGLHGEGLPSAVGEAIDQYGNRHESETNERDRRVRLKALQLAFLPGWASQVQVGPIAQEFVSRALVSKDQKGDTLYFVDKFMAEDRSKLSAYDSSEGTLFLLFVAILLAHHDSPKIFALDNADDALNPRMTRKLLEAVIEITKECSEHRMDCGPRQVFLTSHNPTALDAFDLFDNDQRVFVVARNPLGQSEINRLKPDQEMTREDWAARMGDRNLSQLWIEGAINGALGPVNL